MKEINLISGYIFLIIAIVTGVASNGYLKMTEGFTKIFPILFCVLLLASSVFQKQ